MQNNINRLIEIIEEFKQVRDKTQLQITPDALFTNARALFISEMISQQRGHSVSQQVRTEQPATDKQLNYLKALGVGVPDNLSKKQAFLLIKESVGNNDT